MRSVDDLYKKQKFIIYFGFSVPQCGGGAGGEGD